MDAIRSGPVGRTPRATVRQCPAHSDSAPSLSIGAGRKHQALLHCHAGCSTSSVLAALSLPMTYLWEPPPVPADAFARAFVKGLAFPPLTRGSRNPQNPQNGYRLDAIHDYGPHHRVLRYRKGAAKELHWETLRDGSWLPGLFGTPTAALPLYRELDVRKAVATDEPVLLVESESSVDALTTWYSTTWAGGANAVQIDRLNAVLGGYPHLLVIPDHDEPGLAALDRLRGAGLAAHVLLPDPGEDARDLHDRLVPAAFNTAVHAALATKEHVMNHQEHK